MSGEVEELEEGELTDSDSMGEEEQKCTAEAKKPPMQQYSMFGDQRKTVPKVQPIPRPPRSDSESSNSDVSDNDDDGDNEIQKRSKLHHRGADNHEPKPFLNPNFVKNGGIMPPMPKHAKRSIWGSVLQEQILTAEVGGFSMEKKIVSDRNVESYDYTRAKEDDRPDVVEDEMNNEEDLFGEVIDLERSTLKQKKTLKRKHVGDRLGKRHNVKDRLRELPKVTENSSVEEVTFYISTKLEEAKVHLIRRVVTTLKPAKALDLYKKTEEIEASGGMMIMNGSRRRTKGGVYLTLLKSDEGVTKEQVDEIFEEENQWALEMKKRKKLRAQKRKKEQKRQQQATKPAAEVKGDNPGSMEVAEDSNSRSSVEGQTGSPKNHADHLSDTQEEAGGKERLLSDDSHDGEDISEDDEDEDFKSRLDRELKRQAAAQEAKGGDKGGGESEAVTLDDVLDIGVDEEFID